MTLSATEHQQSLKPYIEAGIDRAAMLGNRGPVKFGDDGKLTADILEAYWHTGFYVFEGLVNKGELALLQADMQSLQAQSPTDNVDLKEKRGRSDV